MGHAEGLSKAGSSTELLLSDPVSEQDFDEDVESPSPREILYTGSFEELAAKNVLYDMIMWGFISLLLVLAWGIGVVMLLYLPVRRYVLQKEISSRKLFVTPYEIVYKVSRPSFIPFCGEVKFERHVPLSRVIDIIVEQGCLQTMFGLHTIRIESIAQGKHAPVDELQLQGLYRPELLRKVIITQASKGIQEAEGNWKPASESTEVGNMARVESLTGGKDVMASPSKAWKTMQMTGSPHRFPTEQRGFATSELLLNKLEEVTNTVKKLEFLIEKSHASPRSS